MIHDKLCRCYGDPQFDYLTYCEICAAFKAVRDNEARAAADRVEALPWLDHGRTVNRNDAIRAARRGLTRRA